MSRLRPCSLSDRSAKLWWLLELKLLLMVLRNVCLKHHWLTSKMMRLLSVSSSLLLRISKVRTASQTFTAWSDNRQAQVTDQEMTDPDWGSCWCENHWWLSFEVILHWFHNKASWPNQEDSLCQAFISESHLQEDSGYHYSWCRHWWPQGRS